MHIINIPHDFWYMNTNDIYVKLLMLKQTEFIIRYEKSVIYSLEDPDCEDKTQDYLFAAYVGQQLYKIAQHFGYFVPAVNSSDPYIFHVITTDIYQLADTLRYIGHANLKEEENAHEIFVEDAIRWYENIQDPFKEVACYGLYSITKGR